MTTEINEVLMPLMGEGVHEATLVKWLKKVGDRVEKDEPLVEVSTDKVDTEIPATSSGYVIFLNAKDGDTVYVDQVLAAISENKDAVYTPSTMESKPTVRATAQKATTENNAAPVAAAGAHAPRMPAPAGHAMPEGANRVSPLVRKIALEHHIDLRFVRGTGLAGRITKRDMERFITEGYTPERNAQGATHANPSAFHNLKTETVEGVECLDGVPVRREKMSKMRRLIAEHMVESVRISPHVTTVFEIDLHRVVQSREQRKAAFKDKEGFNLTYTHYFIHATAQALKEYPILNSSLDGDDILYKEDINIGCAVALESGLIVPVIKKAQNMGLDDIARSLNDLITRARSKKLSPDDVKGGTFSITNPGGFGSLTSNPIINQPQVGILGIGNIVKRPVVIDDQITIRPMVLLSITFDHRVADGESGAKFLAHLKNILENYS